MNKPGVEFLAGHAWAMERGRFEALKAKLLTAEIAAQGGVAKPPAVGFEVRDGTLHLRIGGVLLKSVPWFFSFLGIDATSTEDARAVIAEAMADESIKAIHLEVDSPGGTVDGIQALADDIYDATKPITAHAPDIAASAAYWVLSQADKATAGSTAAIGSIGVYTVYQDLSEMAEDLGIKVHVISNHELKGTGVPGAPITEEQLADIQRVVDAYTDRFVSSVARGRGVSKSEIRDLATGQVWIGKDAKRRNLVDAIAKDEPATQPQPPAEEKPAPLGATNPKQEASIMDPKDIKTAELLARIEQLEQDNQAAKEAIDKATARADSATAQARDRLMAQYANRIEPAKKAAVEEYAEYCGDDLAKLETHLKSLPAAANPNPVGTSGSNAGPTVTVNPGEAKVETMLGLRPGTLAIMGDVDRYDPASRCFVRKDGSTIRAEEVN